MLTSIKHLCIITICYYKNKKPQFCISRPAFEHSSKHCRLLGTKHDFLLRGYLGVWDIRFGTLLEDKSHYALKCKLVKERKCVCQAMSFPLRRTKKY